MEIKQCAVAMVQELAEIGRRTFAETFLADNTAEDMKKFLTETYDPKRLTAELQDPDSITFLAYEGDTVLGYLKLNRGAAQTEEGFANSLEIQRIYVAKEAKGQGVGSHFMDLAEMQAKKWNLSYLWLGVWEHNPKAIRFYENKGFSKFSEHVFVVGDDRQTDWLMRKDLVK